ncbi:MAG TPA: BNR-4 repeat-containing protein [Lentisphaeria bacterium]|nr:BNR-4 repeat-containing protein [Lentisphaeria bacterium]
MNALMRMSVAGGAPAFGTVAAAGAMQGQWVYDITKQTTNNLFVGSAGQGGQFYCSKINRSTNAVNVTTLATREVDDHNVPAFIQQADGKIRALYSRHGIASVLYTRMSASADSDDWGTETTFATSGNATYAQAFVNGTRTWLLYRVADAGSGHWVIRYSDDYGATWSAEVNLTEIPYLNARLSGGILRIAMYEHPYAGSDHDIYGFRITLSTGAVADDNGASLGNVLTDTGLPVTQAESHKLVDVTSGSTRMYDYSVDGNSVLASEFPDANSGTYYRYTYASATGLSTKLAICSSGPAFFASVSNYFASCCFKDGDVNTVYAARNMGPAVGVGNYVIEKYDLSSGAPVKVATIHRSPNILCRLYHRDGRLFWSEVTSYPTFSSFRGDLKFVAAT